MRAPKVTSVISRPAWVTPRMPTPIDSTAMNSMAFCGTLRSLTRARNFGN